MSSRQKITYSGLTNHGATCYMNTLLQTLFLTEEFRDKLFDWKYDEKVQNEEDSTPLQLQILFSEMVKHTERYYDTKPLIKTFQWPASEQFQQQDIQEFTRILFHTIEVSCESTWINDIYQGTVENFVHCKVCDKESIRLEVFSDLSMTVRNLFDGIQNNSLEKALKYYIKPEELTGDNSYYCEGCEKKQNAIKGSRFKSLPPVLTFVLSRFELDLETFLRKKINHFMHFPPILNMNKFFRQYQDIDAYDPPKMEQNDAEDSKEEKKPESNSKLQNQSVPKNIGKRKGSFDVSSSSQDQQSKLLVDDGINLKQEYFRTSKDETSIQQEKKEGVQLTESEEAQFRKEQKFSLQQSKLELDEKLQNSQQKQTIGNDDNNKGKQTELKEIKSENSQQKKQKKGVKFNNNPALVTGADEIYDFEDDGCVGLFNTNTVDDSFDLWGDEKVNYNFENSEEKKQKSLEEQKKRDEENEKKWKEILEKQDEHQNDIDGLIQEYLKEGEYVYELYAVNVHSGGAMGGHYYSYVKSFENQQWSCFNDTSVSPVSHEVTQSTFGEHNPKFNAGSSAYMLSYRKVRVGENGKQIYQIPREPPAYINEMIEKEVQRRVKEAQREMERKAELRKILSIKVIYNQVTKPIDISRSEKLQDLLNKIKIEHNIQLKDENWRIRLYHVYDQLMKNTYTGKEEEILENLDFDSGRTYIIQTKGDAQTFEEYDPKNIIVKVSAWRSNFLNLDDINIKPVQFTFRPEKTTVKNMMEKIEEVFRIPLNKQCLQKRLLKAETFTQSINDTEEKQQKTLSDLLFYNAIQLYVEEVPDNTNLSNNKGKWEQEFEMDKNRCVISFNYPTKQGSRATPNFEHQVAIDNRKTLLELKERISDILQIKMEDFILKKNAFSPELRDLTTLICNNQMRNKGTIVCQLGIPTQPGEFIFQFVRASLSVEQIDKLSFDISEFPSEINEMKVSQDIKIYDLKKILCEKLKKLEVIETVPERIRIREKVGERLTIVLHNHLTIKEQIKNIFDRKVLCITFLESDEVSDPQDLLLYSKLWNVYNFDLSEVKEFYINKSATLGELGELLAALHGVNSQYIEGVNQQQIGIVKFDRSMLLDIDGWVPLFNNLSELTTQPWFCSDGTMIIIRDQSMEKQGNDEQMQQIKKDFENKQQQLNKQDVRKCNPIGRKYVPEKAMKITVKKKGDEEQQEQVQQQQNIETNNQQINSGETKNQPDIENQVKKQEPQEEEVQQDPSTEQQSQKQQQQSQSEDIQQQNQGDQNIISQLKQKLKLQEEDCLQIPEIKKLNRFEFDDQQSYVWEIEIYIEEETSLYYQKTVDIVVIYSQNFLMGAMPQFLVKQALFHPNINMSENQIFKISKYNGWHEFNGESLVRHDDLFTGIIASILLDRIIVQIHEEPNADNSMFFSNKEAAMTYLKSDSSYYNLAVKQNLKQIYQKK